MVRLCDDCVSLGECSQVPEECKGYEQKSMEELIAEVMAEYKDWAMLLMTCPNKCKGQPPWACLAKPLPDGSYEFEGNEDKCDVCDSVGIILASSLDEKGEGEDECAGEETR